MATVTKSIEVNVPVRAAYNQWTQFEEFPRFMEGVKEVRQIDDQHLQWRAEIGGTEQEWQARIVEQVPDQRIAWHSVAGDENAGVVTFHYIDEDTTRVTLQMGYEPEGLKERLGDALGFMERKVQGDLERFKDFIERRGRETGGWRGTIDEHPHADPT
ncbi:SRPBCC family protein [Sphaerobacter thermophilus]|jgi:uncharacterized membrane protein|uniref:Cyclase/dehydrase n=1 Tax=Sphaerobacter thermophilus (strain ATCC 49802 / DSM 20745 / KCCM 41009 / NCIMB 13125 / S 6022) TaxID=479434 RepID=D1C8F1_SPHTD|nr:SRPBCC family protein [Sphaerobacter thermophilus]ACZ40094.1 cyclase/dehydrase [Sphaerobacter thermophilus DSM 20745]PZN68445.1 MAG: cyclase [Sphaerobacter thermophilus]